MDVLGDTRETIATGSAVVARVHRHALRGNGAGSRGDGAAAVPSPGENNLPWPSRRRSPSSAVPWPARRASGVSSRGRLGAAAAPARDLGRSPQPRRHRLAAAAWLSALAGPSPARSSAVAAG
jgi:hypothetical protein